MSTKCFTCTKPIINGDFIKCEGTCAEKFHSKCVSLNRTTLNAIGSCPNIHWFCHECNNGNKAIGTSIDNMRNAVDGLTKSLSSDLLGGFKLLTDTLASSLSSIHRSSISLPAEDSNSSKRRREDATNDYGSEDTLTVKKTRFTVNPFSPNIKSNEPSVATVHVSDTKTVERRRSIVVSNIGKGTSPECLTDYLSNEISVDASEIKTTLLKNARIADNEMKFLQFRISVPENMYNRVRASGTWPKGVQVRDYVFNRRGGSAAVSREIFLSKRTPQEHAHIASHPSLNPPTEPVSTADVAYLIDITDVESPITLSSEVEQIN